MRKPHAIAGVVGFLCVIIFIVSTIRSELSGDIVWIAAVKSNIFIGTFVLVAIVMISGATGLKMLGTRTEILALTKQKRGPMAFMTSLLVLLPSAYFLSRWASAGSLGTWFYAVQTIEFIGSAFVLTMIGLNIRDGIALTGRIGVKTTVKGPSIDQREGGPLVAMAVPNLIGEVGEALNTKGVMALCRCGASKTKPFCDGSHNDIGFDSSPSEDRTKDEVLVYEGKEITVHYNRLLCSHAAECGKRNKAAFDSSRKPWIKPDNGTTDEIMEIVKACPSGALRYSTGADPQHANPDFKGIQIEKNGPYRVTGVPLSDPRLATGANAEKFVLCRCGASKNKPYCDGSHFDIAWDSSK